VVDRAFGAQSIVGRSKQASAPPRPHPATGRSMRCISPDRSRSMSGRISDLAVYEATRRILLRRHGARRRVEDDDRGHVVRGAVPDQGLISIGDVTVSQSNPDLVGVRHRRSNKTPEHVVGRRRVQIGRRRPDVDAHGAADVPLHQPIVIDPRKQRRVFVAATAPVGPRRERGIYKTTTGQGWKQV